MADQLQGLGLNDRTPSAELELLCVRNLLANRAERIFFKDLDSRFILVSQGWLDAYADGRGLTRVIGQTDSDMFSDSHASEALRDEQRIMQTGGSVISKTERETFADRPDAWVSTTKLPLRDESGQIIGTYGISRDVTAQVQAQRTLAHQALHDLVTGLPNRTALTDRLTQALLALERRPGRLALMFIDLDDFKGVNDALGHDAGDRVLAEVGDRLSRLARRTDTVARLGGDEFVMLCPQLRDREDIRLLGDRILKELRAPIGGGPGADRDREPRRGRDGGSDGRPDGASAAGRRGHVRGQAVGTRPLRGV